MSEHVHRRPRTCNCNSMALEPNEDCPRHGGGEWPPRCEYCGQFMPWPKIPEIGQGVTYEIVPEVGAFGMMPERG